MTGNVEVRPGDTLVSTSPGGLTYFVLSVVKKRAYLYEVVLLSDENRIESVRWQDCKFDCDDFSLIRGA